LTAGDDILSVGCGPAIIEAGLSERGFKVTGLDISQEALDHAPDGVRTVAARAEDMPFPASSFDIVIFVASLQFIEDYRKAIEKSASVLRSNGRLIAMLLNPESGFFKRKLSDPSSYIRRIRHVDMSEMETTMSTHFDICTEYSLGIRGDTVFDSQDPAEAVLYIIKGTKKRIAKSG
jgi:ubiquinone/menaquinone biosynthesis C-methylase UbiE